MLPHFNHSWPQRYLLTFELASHCELLPAVPAVVALAVLRHHGRVGEILLGKAAPPVVLPPVALKRLVKKRIEGFSSSDGCGTEIIFDITYIKNLLNNKKNIISGSDFHKNSLKPYNWMCTYSKEKKRHQ